MVVDLGQIVVISKKNISGIQHLTKHLTPLDYAILSTLFVDEETRFEKFSTKNNDVSDRAIRQRTVEAVDLRENFSQLGASKHTLSNVRINNNNQKTILSLNTSRINKFGKKDKIKAFVRWARSLVPLIENHEPKETFLSIFAEPLDYESQRDELIPISILFSFSQLYEDFENDRFADCLFVTKGGENISVNITKYLSEFERLCELTELDNDHSYSISNSTANDFNLKLYKKSIRIQSAKLRNLILVRTDGNRQNIVDYMNQSCQFIVNFESIDLVYTNRKLFRDRKLLGNIDNFMSIFSPHAELDTVTSEKGGLQANYENFEDTSIFGFVESEFLDQYDYFVCDDLGDEWADHIGITDDRIAFFHSKHATSQYSAGDFQDIVGQTQKNLGNLTPTDFRLASKANFWSQDYKNNKVETSIPRLRKGNSINDLTTQYTMTINNPNLTKDVFLIVDFISKASLEGWLNQLANDEQFREKNQVTQILWFISSLVSSCSELGVHPHIVCKP